jgi:CubicO group peptidase (beta-lactamase class C family)
MKTRLSIALVLWALMPISVSLGQRSTAAQPAATESVGRLFATWDKPESPGCAVAVIKDGKVIYQRGYGIANLEYNIPITPSTTED